METLVQLVTLLVYLLAALSGMITAVAALLWSARQQQQLEGDRLALIDLRAREADCQKRLAAVEARLKVMEDGTARAAPAGQRQPTALS